MDLKAARRRLNRKTIWIETFFSLFEVINREMLPQISMPFSGVKSSPPSSLGTSCCREAWLMRWDRPDVLPHRPQALLELVRNWFLKLHEFRALVCHLISNLLAHMLAHLVVISSQILWPEERLWRMLLRRLLLSWSLASLSNVDRNQPLVWESAIRIETLWSLSLTNVASQRHWRRFGMRLTLFAVCPSLRPCLSSKCILLVLPSTCFLLSVKLRPTPSGEASKLRISKFVRFLPFNLSFLMT